MASTETIQLDQFLKLVGAVATGGETPPDVPEASVTFSQPRAVCCQSWLAPARQR